MTKTVRKYFDVCQRCGGADAKEVAVGDTVTLYLTDTDTNLPATLEAIVVDVEAGSLTDTTGRYYTFQYDNTTLLPDNTEISACDIVSALCQSCCVLLQAQIDAIRAASKPYVSLTYKWLPDTENVPFRKARLYAYAFPALGDASIISYRFYQNDGTEIMSGDVTQSFIDVPDSILPLYTGAPYYVIATDTGGRTGRADVNISPDDSVFELSTIRREEVTLGLEYHVQRLSERDTYGTEFFGGLGQWNPDSWFSEYNMCGVGVMTVGFDQIPVIRVSEHHALVGYPVDMELGLNISFYSKEPQVLHTATVQDFRDIGFGLFIVAFMEEIPVEDVPVVRILPKIYKDWFNTPVSGMRIGTAASILQGSTVRIDDISDSGLTLTDGGMAPGYVEVDSNIGSFIVVIEQCEPILVGWNSGVPHSITWQGVVINMLTAIAEMAACPPYPDGSLVPARFLESVDWCNVRERPFVHTSLVRGTSLGIEALFGFNSDTGTNVAVGMAAGKSVKTGIRNIFIGDYSDVSSAAHSDNTILGYSAVVDGDGEILIGNGVSGLGDNKTVIGHADTVATFLRGWLNLGNDTDPRGLFDFNGSSSSMWLDSTATTLHLTNGNFTFKNDDAAGGFIFRPGNTSSDSSSVFITSAGALGVRTATVDAANMAEFSGTSGEVAVNVDGKTLTFKGLAAIEAVIQVSDYGLGTDTLKLVAPSGISLFAGANQRIAISSAGVNLLTSAGAWAFTNPSGTINQVSAAGAELVINSTDAGSVIRQKVNGTTRLSLSNTGNGLATFVSDITLDDAAAVRVLTFGNTNGAKIGATGNKIGFFGANPIVKPAGDATTGTTTAGAGAAVKDDSTFDGGLGGAAYTLQGAIKQLKLLGLL